MKRIKPGEAQIKVGIRQRFSTFHSYQQRKKVAKKEIAASTSYFLLDNERLKKAH
jgi:hypothetical protein